MPLLYNDDGNLERTAKRARVKIEPPIGKYPVYSREMSGLSEPYHYLPTESGKLIAIYGAGYFGIQQSDHPSKVTEERIDAYFAAARESFENSLQDPAHWADFTHAAICNRIDDAEKHNQPIRIAREKERAQERKERLEQEKQLKREREQIFNANLDEMANGIMNGDKVTVEIDHYRDKNPLARPV
ncbi:MAG: hypothetical protein LBU32_07020 [Clostridiales bacterium]|jgi:hypothetical protein|nr:hypothetical protein [Clostridiales bacterium]